MRQPTDFAGGRPGAVYCSTCAESDGALRPFDVVVQGNADYFVKYQGIAPEAARDMARALLLSMPAWKHRV
jgi:hypothetical protein